MAILKALSHGSWRLAFFTSVCLALMSASQGAVAQNPTLGDILKGAIDQARKANQAQKGTDAPPSNQATPQQTQKQSAPPLPDENTPRNKYIPDILGISTGMKADQVLAILNKEYPREQVKQSMAYFKRPGPTFLSVLRVHNEDRAHASLNMADWKTQETVVVKFSLPPSESRVLYMARAVFPSQREPLATTVLIQALMDKFGTPTQDSGPPTGDLGRQIYWFWDISGKPSKLPSTAMGQQVPGVFSNVGSNRNNMIGGRITDDNDNQAANPSAFSPEVMRYGCATAVQVLLTVNGQNKGLITNYRIVAIDLDAGFMAASKTHKYQNEREAADKAGEIQKATANKPKL